MGDLVADDALKARKMGLKSHFRLESLMVYPIKSQPKVAFILLKLPLV